MRDLEIGCSHLQRIEVKLGRRSYPISVGPGLLGRGELFTDTLAGKDVLLVTNDTVGPLYAGRVRSSLRAACAEVNVVELELPDGEEHKTLATAARIWDALVENRFHRDAAIVALGGGVIGDIAGFAAACYQRGIACVQIPTTLLAQVDSSVGGKTAVNHPEGKNLIGAFHQPVGVVADTSTLETLDEREFRAGLAEVVKYGLILDVEFFHWLERNMPALLRRDSEALMHAIRVSCEIKARIVAEDEQERGRRALLNLGHTFGHAIETGMGYGTWLHGEAVAAGLCMAARMSREAGWLAGEAVERTEQLVAAAGLPSRPPELEPERFRALMQMDKKVAGGKIVLVLLEKLGGAVVTADYPETALAAVLENPAG